MEEKMSDNEDVFTVDEKFNLLFGQVARIIMYLQSKDPDYIDNANAIHNDHIEKMEGIFTPEYTQTLTHTAKRLLNRGEL